MNHPPTMPEDINNRKGHACDHAATVIQRQIMPGVIETILSLKMSSADIDSALAKLMSGGVP